MFLSLKHFEIPVIDPASFLNVEGKITVVFLSIDLFIQQFKTLGTVN